MTSWLTRHPALLLLLAAMTSAYSPFPAIRLNRSNCSECEAECKESAFRQLHVDTHTCLKCACLNSSVSYFETFRQTHLEDVAFLHATEPYFHAATAVSFFCLRWVSATSTSPSRTYLTRRRQPTLPDPSQQRWFTATLGGFLVSVINTTLSVDSSTTDDHLQCRANRSFCGHRCSSIPLFAYNQSEPVIRGVSTVRPGVRAVWQCDVDFATYKTQQDLEMTLEVVDGGYLHTELQGPDVTFVNIRHLQGKKLTMSMALTTPQRLTDSTFDVRCTCLNRYLGAATTTSVTVTVPDTAVVVSLSSVLSTVGGAFGGLGLALTLIFIARFVVKGVKKRRARRQTQTAATQHGTAPQSPASPNPPTALKPKASGILKHSQPASVPQLKKPPAEPEDSSLAPSELTDVSDTPSQP